MSTSSEALKNTAVVLFTQAGDPYSARARTLLQRKGISFTEKQLPACREELIALTGSVACPQIIIHGKHIGSFEQLGSLELQGKLDALIEGK